MEFTWLNEDSRTFLSRGYLKEGVTPEERVRQIAERAEKLLGFDGFADKVVDYFSRKFYSFSSPIWANFGLENLPISCNGSMVEDDTAHILTKVAEMGMMSKYGAGTSAYFGKIRPRGSAISTGGQTDGPIPFLRIFDTTNVTISQGQVRRGIMGVYLDIEHPDIEEFLGIRSDKHSIQHLFPGVCITDKWMEDLLAGKKENKKLWAKLINARFEKGVPYIFFTDTVNNNKADVYKDNDMQVYGSNVCTEITLPANAIESFVCNLASMNLETYDDWKDTDAVEVLVYLLDAVLTEYIEKCKVLPYMDHARRFAERHRAIGVGVLGWHSYLQKHMIAFESMKAKFLTHEIFKLLQTRTLEASKYLASIFGEPEVLKGYGRRNTTLMAIAPTKSSAFILGQVSEGIEPYNSNYQTLARAKGQFAFKNPYLQNLLESKGQNKKDVWKSILENGGSVQHLTEILTDEERDVFKTCWEISQHEIVLQASLRQKYIDQSQSLNIFVLSPTPTGDPKEMEKKINKLQADVSKLVVFAWKNGIKTLYYQFNNSPTQALSKTSFECASCES